MAGEDSAHSLEPSKIAWHRIFLVWTVPVLLTVAERIYFALLAPSGPAIWTLVVGSAVPFYTYALLTPLLAHATQRYRPSRVIDARTVVVQVALWLFCVCLMVGVSTLVNMQIAAIGRNASFGAALLRSLIGFFPTATLVHVAAVGVLAWRFADADARQSERLAAGLVKAELLALRMQVHPHFLFNALNSIAVLVREGDREAAATVVMRLGNMLRAMLEGDTTHLVPLRREIALTADYLEIEQARFGDRLTVQWQIDASLLDRTVPVFVLQPLVENAVRHGVGLAVGPSTIEIRATEVGHRMQLSVSDWSSLASRDSTPTDIGFGIGLENTKTRLRLLYGDQGELVAGRNARGEYVATVRLPMSAAVP